MFNHFLNFEFDALYFDLSIKQHVFDKNKLTFYPLNLHSNTISCNLYFKKVFLLHHQKVYFDNDVLP